MNGQLPGDAGARPAQPPLPPRPPRAPRPVIDEDERAVRRTARRVAIQLALAIAIALAAAVLLVLVFILTRIRPSELFEVTKRNSIDVGVRQAVTAAVIGGVLAIALAGILAWFATRRAVRPLGQALRLQRQFVSDASHELRTPLTVLDARLQLLQRSLPPGDASQPVVAELRRDARSLIDIVNDLLEVAEIERSTKRREPIELGAVVAGAVDSLGVIAAERSISVTFSAVEPLWARIPAASLKRCVVALVDNAIRHSPDGARIDVRLDARRGTVVLSVRDSGSGILGIDPARIFDRFVHAEPAGDSVDSPTQGYGIGLALVREVAARYAGSVAVRETGETGTVIALTLPRVSAPHS